MSFKIGDKVCLREKVAKGNILNYRIEAILGDNKYKIAKCSSCRSPLTVSGDEIILTAEAKKIMAEAMNEYKTEVAKRILTR